MENVIRKVLKVNDIELEIIGWSISEDLSSQNSSSEDKSPYEYNLNIHGNVTQNYIALSKQIKENNIVEKIIIDQPKSLLTFEGASFYSLNVNSSYDDNLIGDFSITILYKKSSIEIKQ